MKNFRLTFSAVILTIVFLAAFSSCNKTEVCEPQNHFPTDTMHVSPNDTSLPMPIPVYIRLSKFDDGKTVSAHKNQKIVITLPSAGDGGYQFDEPLFNNTILKLEQHSHTGSADPNAVGDFGHDEWTFTVIGNGTTYLQITDSQPWDGGVKSKQQFFAGIVVQ